MHFNFEVAFLFYFSLNKYDSNLFITKNLRYQPIEENNEENKKLNSGDSNNKLMSYIFGSHDFEESFLKRLFNPSSKKSCHFTSRLVSVRLHVFFFNNCNLILLTLFFKFLGLDNFCFNQHIYSKSFVIYS